MMGDCGKRCEKVLVEIKGILKEIDQKLSHLIEQNRIERILYPER